MGAAGQPDAAETAGPTVTLAVGSRPSQELVEGTLDDVGSRVYTEDRLDSKG